MATKKTIPTTSDYIKDSSREYSIYVCESRAIPSVADGQKDGPRKALWLMHSRIGGVTGDVFGMIIEIVEATVLIAFLIGT